MTNWKPLVSVITPSYNARDYIEDTVHSVLDQSHPHWEMIIVDDCSTDGTRDILQQYEKIDERIHVVYLEENSGAAVARNKALERAQGRYVAFLDSDDKWKKDKLEKQLEFMMERSCAFSFTGYSLMAQDGTPLDKFIHAPESLTYDDALKNTIIGCLTVMIDREQTGQIQMPNIRTRQDLATWLSLLKKGFTAYGMNECLAEYRLVNNSISSNKWKAARKTWFVYREIERLHFMKATWCFVQYAKNAVKKRL
ncbi:glycosyltransferase family 2 protein [Bacillus subtilis]|mgnify:FL=1|uniref:teichuronic acid biosynthesis protein TuaG n=1 Tax=Bacillus TaxID=1386 RepID=UPI0003AA2168|nr:MULTISPECIES: glycosyltransferase family 2 protein [Bacillus]MBW4825267.1 glycosyltransferase [Bacillaceae bacterium]AJO59925.1 glycosyl transferase [Bacillus sp. YP1]ASC01120.1 glycosyl transferase [Bacillus subtilis]AXF34837.1 glycosyltransferase family 2 protein [Bacillus sp. DM2]KAF1340081.1 putative teichuronic acid biosynthesis glycosyltransferase TuaG [Bacillus subtilis]